MLRTYPCLSIHAPHCAREPQHSSEIGQGTALTRFRSNLWGVPQRRKKGLLRQSLTMLTRLAWCQRCAPPHLTIGLYVLNDFSLCSFSLGLHITKYQRIIWEAHNHIFWVLTLTKCHSLASILNFQTPPPSPGSHSRPLLHLHLPAFTGCLSHRRPPDLQCNLGSGEALGRYRQPCLEFA